MSRTYHLEDPIGGGMTLTATNDKDCIFCKHCHVFWNYTNGLYMFLCDKDRPECSEIGPPEEHTCELFEESEEGV